MGKRSSHPLDPMELGISGQFDLLSRMWTVWTEASVVSLLTLVNARTPHAIGLLCGAAALAGLPVTTLAWNGVAHRVLDAEELAQELFARTAPRAIARGGSSRERLKRRLRALPPTEIDLLAAAAEAEPKAAAARRQLRLGFTLFALQIVFTLGCWATLTVSSTWQGGLVAFACLVSAVACRAVGEALQVLQRTCSLTAAALRLCGREAEPEEEQALGREEEGVASLLDAMRVSLPNELQAWRHPRAAMLGGIWWLCILVSCLACIVPGLFAPGVAVGMAGLAAGCLSVRAIRVPRAGALTVVRVCAIASGHHTAEQAWDFRRTAGQLVAAARVGGRATNLIFEATTLALSAWLLGVSPSPTGESLRIALFVPVVTLLWAYARELPVADAARRIRDVRGRIRTLEARYCPGDSVHTA